MEEMGCVCQASLQLLGMNDSDAAVPGKCSQLDRRKELI